MRLYFAGSEVSSWRKLLKEQSVPDVALSFVGLKRRVSGTDRWLLSTHYPEDQRIFLDSGAFSLNRQVSPDGETLDGAPGDEEIMELATSYMAFVLNNIDRVDMVSEFDAVALGEEWLASMRADFYDQLPQNKFMPIWHSDTGLETLQAMARRYPRIGILQTSLGERDLTTFLNGLVTNYGTKLHGVGMTKMDAMREVHWDSVSSLSWLRTSISGDTFVWDGHALHRYPKKYKKECRSRHRALFTRNGFDAAKIIADAGDEGTPEDKKEVLRLSLWSWQKFVDDINHTVTMDPFGTRPIGNRVVSTIDESEVDHSVPQPGTGVSTLGSEGGNGELVPRTPIHREKVLIPVMGITHAPVPADAEEGTIGDPLLAVGDSTLLQCDNCFMKSYCPGFQPHHECLYEFPVEVKTVTQTAAVMDGLIKMQTQRVLRLQMYEQVMGGDSDPNLDSAIDRLAKLIKQKYDANREGIDIHINASRPAGQGPLSRFMGPDIAERINARPEPTTVQQMAIDSGVIQGNVES